MMKSIARAVKAGGKIPAVLSLVWTGSLAWGAVVATGDPIYAILVGAAWFFGFMCK